MAASFLNRAEEAQRRGTSADTQQIQYPRTRSAWPECASGKKVRVSAGRAEVEHGKQKSKISMRSLLRTGPHHICIAREHRGFSQSGSVWISIQDKSHPIWRQPSQMNEVTYIIIRDAFPSSYLGHQICPSRSELLDPSEWARAIAFTTAGSGRDENFLGCSTTSFVALSPGAEITRLA